MTSQLLNPFLLLIVVVVTGVAGYMMLEGWTLLDAFYMVAITLSTVGFKEVGDISVAGRIFTIGLIVFGISTAGYLITRFGEVVIEGQFRGHARRRRMNQRIQDLENHYIICGCGRVGQQVAEQFAKEGMEFVVIEKDPEKEEELREDGCLYLIGDASEDETLEQAGIERATGVAVAVDSDADNVFVTLSARSLNPRACIVSVARDPDTEHKLHRAGATRVVSPFLIAGRRMASMVIRPDTVEYLDTVMQRSGSELRIEEFSIPEGSHLVGQTLREADLRAQAGVMVLAIKELQTGTYVHNPSGDKTLTNTLRLIALGTDSQLKALQSVVRA